MKSFILVILLQIGTNKASVLVNVEEGAEIPSFVVFYKCLRNIVLLGAALIAAFVPKFLIEKCKFVLKDADISIPK